MAGAGGDARNAQREKQKEAQGSKLEGSGISGVCVFNPECIERRAFLRVIYLGSDYFAADYNGFFCSFVRPRDSRSCQL